MKKGKKIFWFIICALMAAGSFYMAASSTVQDVFAYSSSSKDVIHKGIYAGDIDLSDMTTDEAVSKINAYVNTLKDAEIELKAIDDASVSVKAGELGLKWANDGIIKEATDLGKAGNIVTAAATGIVAANDIIGKI